MGDDPSDEVDACGFGRVDDRAREQQLGGALAPDQPGQVVSFGTDAKGELYVVSLGGSIYRLDPA